MGHSLLNKFGSSILIKYNIEYKSIKDGKKIHDLVDSGDYWKIKEAERILKEQEGKYRESKQKKWIIMVVGMILGGVIGYYLPVTVFALSNSVFQRGPIDSLLKEMFGK